MKGGGVVRTMMTEDHTFSVYLCVFKSYPTTFQGKFIIIWSGLIVVSEDYLQLPSVMGRAAFQSSKSIGYNSVGGNLWVQLYKIYELTEMVRQSSDL